MLKKYCVESCKGRGEERTLVMKDVAARRLWDSNCLTILLVVIKLLTFVIQTSSCVGHNSRQ